MGKVLVPLDGSGRAAAVLPTAAAVARAMGCELELLQVVVPEGTARSRVDADREWDEGQARARAYLEQVAAGLGAPDLPVTIATAGGHPATGIVQTVRQDPLITYIVMATHGRSGVPRWVFGSTAEEVLRAAGVPILLLRDGQRLPVLTAGCTILVPLADDAPTPVGETAGWSDEAQQQAGHRVTRELEQTARQIAAPGLPVQIAVLHGTPAEEIAGLAATAGAALIVMATHGQSGPFPRRWGSVALAVLRRAAVPVVLRCVARPRVPGVAEELGLGALLPL
jgi:nucleotide-binding universal stress UspA family protein